jgi:hypothetical protein
MLLPDVRLARLVEKLGKGGQSSAAGRGSLTGIGVMANWGFATERTGAKEKEESRVFFDLPFQLFSSAFLFALYELFGESLFRPPSADLDRQIWVQPTVGSLACSRESNAP